MDHCVILGAGHGGVQAALSLRQEGYCGRITLISEEAELPYHKPQLSKSFLKQPNADPLLIRAQTVYDENRIDLMLGREVTRLDPRGRRVELAGGDSVAFDAAVLAMGARARSLSISGCELEGVLSLRSLADARAIAGALVGATTAVVIGGGFIGMELACCFSESGLAVTVLEATPRVLGRSVSEHTSTYVESFFAGQGIEIVKSAKVECIEGAGGKVVGVRLLDGRLVGADLVVIGAGAVPNSELASDAGLMVDNGILVDQAMRTSEGSIVAIGDCARFPHWHAQRYVRLESVQNATDQAKFAARALLGKPEPYSEVPWFWSELGSAKLQMAGIAFDADRYPVSGDIGKNAFSVYHFAGRRLLAVDSVNRPAEHMTARRLLAQHVNPTVEQIESGVPTLKNLLRS